MKLTGKLTKVGHTFVLRVYTVDGVKDYDICVDQLNVFVHDEVVIKKGLDNSEYIDYPDIEVEDGSI